MATHDSFDPWIDFLVTDPFSEGPRASRTPDVSAIGSARGDASEARPELELELVYVRRREPLRALELPLPERPEIGGLRDYRRKRRKNPDWLDREREEWTRN